RHASRREAIGAADEMRRVAEGIPGFEVMGGKEVVEARPAGISKGTAMLRLLRDAGGESVLYVGDDTTDEDAFAALEEAASGEAVTVRVGTEGDAPTRARFGIASQAEVAELLRRLIELRTKE